MDVREERRLAWIDDYNFLVDEGFSPAEIIERLNISPNNFYSRLKRWDCKRYTRDQVRIRKLIDIWIKNKERFSSFDFPEDIEGNEAFLVVRDALSAGEIVQLGKKNYRSGSASCKMGVYGVPDAPERVPTLTGARDAGLAGRGYSVVS